MYTCIQRRNRLLSSDHLILVHAKDDKVCPESRYAAKGWRVQISNQNFQCFPTPWVRLCRFFLYFARECTGNLARLLFVKLFSIIAVISMTSSPGSSRKLGIACTWFLHWRFWIICIYQNHWTIIFAYSFPVAMLQKHLLFDWISGI